MLGFLARSAVRAAVGAAVSHNNARREAFAWQQHQEKMNAPFWLIPSATGDSALYYDRRASFSQSLPGWPLAAPTPQTPGEPPCDHAVAIQELPIAVRYRYTGTSPGSHAVANARAIAEAHAGHASGARQALRDAAPYQTKHWCVDAAVTASYTLARPDASGADTEELLVLVRQGASMQVSTRYAAASLDWLRLAMFRSVSLPGLVWDPSAPASSREVWPQSTFLLPGLAASLAPIREQMLPQLVPQFVMRNQEREAMSTQLGALITGEEPPWAAMPPDALASAGDRLMRSTSNPNVHVVVRQALGEVRTAHDLRGVAVWLGRALELATPVG